MKLSPKVLDLEKRCRNTERATLAYADEVCAAWGPRIRAAMTEEERARYGDPEGFLKIVLEVVGAREVRESREAMVDRDRARRDAEDKLRIQRTRRDETAQELYDAISSARQKVRAHLDARQEKQRFFVSGPTPRQPFMLLRWAGAMEDGLRAGEIGDLDEDELEKAAVRIAKVARRLNDAYTAAEEAKVRKRIALHDRQLAVEGCEAVYLKGSRFVEAALRAAGFDHYARKVRGVARPGRPRKKRKGTPRRRKTANSPSKPSSATPESFSWTSQALRGARRSFSRLSQAVLGTRGSFSRR